MANLPAWTPTIPTRPRFGRLFDEFWGSSEGENGNQHWTPVVDVMETADHYEVHAELPGVEEKDVHLSVRDNVLTLKGEKRYEEAKDGDGYHRVERRYGLFQRSFTLPRGLKTDEIKATFKNGVLAVSIPKPEEIKPRNIQITTG